MRTNEVVIFLEESSGKKYACGRLSAEMAAAAVERAVNYAAEHKIPLTLERLAVELDMDMEKIRTMSADDYAVGWGERALCAVLRRARREVCASVTEFALSRGSGAQAHLHYLSRIDDARSGCENDAVIFLNEDKV